MQREMPKFLHSTYEQTTKLFFWCVNNTFRSTLKTKIKCLVHLLLSKHLATLIKSLYAVFYYSTKMVFYFQVILLCAFLYFLGKRRLLSRRLFCQENWTFMLLSKDLLVWKLAIQQCQRLWKDAAIPQDVLPILKLEKSS